MIEQKRLVIPGQVAREFAKVRIDKLAELYQQLSLKKQIQPIQSGKYPLLSSLPEYQAVEHLRREINRKMGEYQEAISRVLTHVQSWQLNDPVRLLYSELFNQDIILDPPFDEEEIKRDLQRRHIHHIPPGYKDAGKEDSGVGDLLIWYTILELGKTQNKSVIFVSGDGKPDWFRQSENVALNLRYELVDEFRRLSGGHSFHVIKFAKFLKLFGASQKVVEEVRQEEKLLTLQGDTLEASWEVMMAAKLREEMQRRSNADRLLLEADKFAPSLFERERLIKEAVELYPDYKQNRYRQLGIDMSKAVLEDVDPSTPMDMRRLGYGYRFTKDKVERLTTGAISYLRDTVLDATPPDTEGLLYLACMYGFKQQFDEMLAIIEKAVQIDEGIKQEFREPKKLVALLRACGSDASSIAMLGEKIGLELPASKDTFCNFLRNYDLREKHTFIEWLAIRKPDVAGESGVFVIKIDPPYEVKGRRVSASAQSVEAWNFETIIPNTEPVTIEELFNILNSLFFLIYPNE